MLALAKLSHEILRYLVVLVTMPLWLPFVKALWKELNRALRWEGGLFGRAPTEQERDELSQRTLEEEEPLVHEPLAGAGQRRSGFRSANPGALARRAGGRPGARPARPTGPQRRGGFR